MADPIFDDAFMELGETKSPSSNVAPNPNQSNIDLALASEEIKDDILEISGKWEIDLDKASRYFKIFLIQSGNRIQGYGSLVENGTEVPSTAIGIVSEKSMSLDANVVVDGILNTIKKEIYNESISDK